MGAETFVDTSGFYALMAAGDDRHREAVACLREGAAQGRRFVTTDYVLDETATLLRARGLGHLLDRFFQSVLNSQACRVVWTDADDFLRAKDYFLRHRDHEYSFTDCVSFCAMRAAKLRLALSKDEHFREAGFEPLLAP
jgi:predicted nucleic acid-binding protein